MFIGFMISGVMVMVAGLFAIGLACNAVWRAVMPPPGLPRHAGCGSCGYELATLDSGRCSECGADLIKAGITTRRNAVRMAGSLPAALIGWTLIVVGVVVVLLYAVSIFAMTNSAMSMANNYTGSYTYRPARLAPSAGGLGTASDFRVQVDLDVDANWGSRANSGEITVELSVGPDRAIFTFADASTDDWELTDGAGAVLGSGTGLRPGDALAAFRAVGLDPDTETVLHDYADRIEELAGDALADPRGFSTNFSMNSTNLPPGSARLTQISGSSGFSANSNPFGSVGVADVVLPAVILGVAGGVWIAGTVFIVRRRARLIEGPRATPTAT